MRATLGGGVTCARHIIIVQVRQAWPYALSRRLGFSGTPRDHLLVAGIALGVSILVCVPLGMRLV